ncbi:MAG: TolC family protein [Gammaproteobacteria bacterium]
MRKSLIAILCLGASAQIYALTLSEYSEKLTQEHPFYSQLSLSEEANQLTHQTSQLIYGWNAQLNVTDNYSSVNGLNNARVELSTQKAIEETGGNLSIKHSWNDNGLAEPTNLTSVTYSQPFLQNQGGINTSLSADLANIDLESKKLSLIEQSENFLASKSKKFIDLALAQEKVAIVSKNLKLSEQQFNIATEKYAQSILSESSLLQEQDNYIRAKQQFLQAEQDLDSMQKELALWAGINPQMMIAEFDVFQEQSTLNTDTLKLVSNSRTIQQFNFDREKLQRQLMSNQNKLEPSLNLNIGLTSQGSGSGYFDSFSNQSTSFEVGVNFTYAFGNTREQLDIERTKNSLAQLDSRRRESEINLAQQINAQISRIDLLQELTQISLELSLLANDKAAEAQKQYNNAKSQKTNVIAAQKSANTAKLSYVQAATSLQKAIIDYLSLSDQLINTRN